MNLGGVAAVVSDPAAGAHTVTKFTLRWAKFWHNLSVTRTIDAIQARGRAVKVNSRCLAITLLLIGLILPMDSASAAERVAFVVGNGAYTDTNRLPNPVNDANDIANVLRGIGFDVVVGTDLTRQEMVTKLREFSRKLVGARIGLFFYAGHGMQRDGQNYLMPIDAKLEQDGDHFLETIDVQLVLRQMETDQRVSLIFLDACRNNPLARSYAALVGPGRSASLERGLAPPRAVASGTMIAFSTQPDAVALDGQGRNSPFTAALLKHIRTPGLDIGFLMRRVRTDVMAATSRQQTPWDHSSLTDSVVLAPQGTSQPSSGMAGTSTPKSDTATPIPGPQTASAPSAGDPAVTYSPWTKVCSRDNSQRRETCLTVKESRLETGKFLASAALIEQQGEEKKLLRITLPLGMQLPQGTRMTLDTDQPIHGRYVICLPDGCMADFDVTPDFVGKLKKGQQIVLQGINLPGQAASYRLPLAEFARANDGPPTDPGKFEEDQKRRMDEVRRGAQSRGWAPIQQPQANAATAGSPAVVYSTWTKFCGKENAQAKEVCLTVKEARLETGQFLAGGALIEQQGEEKKLFRITLPLGMQLSQGTRMTLDKDQPLQGRYIVCLPNGCMADFDVNNDFVGKVKKGQQIVLQGINLPGQTSSYQLPLSDFARANEGPPTDPKKFEEDQKKQQEELQRKRRL